MRRTNFSWPVTSSKTILGWIAAGSYLSHSNKINALHTIEETDLDTELPSDTVSRILGNFYMAEELHPITQKFTSEDQACEDHFLATHSRNRAGRYIVRLPFKSRDTLGESYEIALKRFYSLERKLQKNESLRKSYNEFIEEYIHR